ncbi:kinesin heavy chain, putative, partial [Perkinsus marinus ATCC 50983]
AFQAAVATRRTSSTNINSHSSRSHCVVTLRTSLPCPYTATCRHGKLNLIDLAGSENVGRSGAKGSTLREAQMINKSLSTLVSIVGLTCQSKTHVPYRNSKLTLMLKDSLGGSAKVLMIAHLS